MANYYKTVPYWYENRKYNVGLMLTDQLVQCKYNSEILTKFEKEKFSKLKTKRRKKEYCMSRIAGKYLLNIYLDNHMEDKSVISILNDKDGAPYYLPDIEGISCGISHSGDYLANIVFPKSICLGIDLEDTLFIKDSIRYAVLPSEMTIMPKGIDDVTFFTMMWVCKEALLKGIHGKMRDGIERYEILDILKMNEGYLIGYKNFPEYQAVCFKWKYMVVAIAGKGIENNANILCCADNFESVNL